MSFIWTDAEVAVLRRLRGQQKSAKEISTVIDRSIQAIKSKITGLGLERQIKRSFTHEEDAAIILLKESGTSWAGIAHILDRHASSVTRRWRTLEAAAPRTVHHDQVKPAALGAWAEAMQGQRFEDVMFKEKPSAIGDGAEGL